MSANVTLAIIDHRGLWKSVSNPGDDRRKSKNRSAILPRITPRVNERYESSYQYASARRVAFTVVWRLVRIAISYACR